MIRHLIIPDVQAKYGEDFTFLKKIGTYIVEKKPNVIIQLGDFSDMESLSSYDQGKKSFEGKRYTKDIEASQEAMECLLQPIREFNIKAKKNKDKLYKPRLILTLGNHEQRINRAVENDPKLEGLIKIEDLPYQDWEVIPFLVPIIVDGVCYCFAFGEKVLTADYTYIPVENLQVGDKLLSFTEKGPDKKYEEAEVSAVEFDSVQTYTVIDSNNINTTVTADHLWLVRKFSCTQYTWVKTKDLKPGYEILQPFTFFRRSPDLNLAWLGGILDGEGWVSKPNCKQGGIQVGIAQNSGIVFDRICETLSNHNYQFSIHKDKNCNCIRILGTLNDKLRLLVETNAIRLLDKLKPHMFGRLQSTGNNSIILDIVPAGKQPIVKIKTTTGTLIVNGQAHHNCHYFPTGVMGRAATTASAMVSKLHMSCIAGHQQGKQVAYGKRPDGSTITCIITGSCYEHNEFYMDHQTNKHWRGIVVLNEVDNGCFDELFVSLKYLNGKYHD